MRAHVEILQQVQEAALGSHNFIKDSVVMTSWYWLAQREAGVAYVILLGAEAAKEHTFPLSIIQSSELTQPHERSPLCPSNQNQNKAKSSRQAKPRKLLLCARNPRQITQPSTVKRRQISPCPALVTCSASTDTRKAHSRVQVTVQQEQ